MERPSHLSLLMPHSNSGRLVRLAVAASVPALVLWGLTHGMTGAAIRDFAPLHYVPDREVQKIEDLPPPPPVKFDPPTVLKPVPPLIVIESPRDAGSVTTTTTGVTSTKPVAPQPAGESHGAAPVMATHTIPPYPLLAQRQGLEGKVTLRLSILADGHVGKAEIVTSSGSAVLDSAASAWITAHWLYKPALQNGQTVPSQATAAVTFSLKDQR